jgi:hypothetical protein
MSPKCQPRLTERDGAAFRRVERLKLCAVSLFIERPLATLGKAQTPHCVPPGLQSGVVEEVEAESIERLNDICANGHPTESLCDERAIFVNEKAPPRGC